MVEDDEFADETTCPMCGAMSADTYEVEPGMQPVCGDCAADYELDGMNNERGPAAQAGRWIAEAEEGPSELVDPGARNHPNDCECPSCAELTESFGFGKFMDRIVCDEHRKTLPVLNDSPQRLRAARNQERPLGRIRIGKVNN